MIIMGNRFIHLSNDAAVNEKRFENPTEFEGGPAGKKWYHGNITDDEAERRLKLVAEKRGNYLVYDLKGSPGEYVLLVWCGEVRRLKISRRSDRRYILGNDNPNLPVVSYQSVKELIKEHRGLTGRHLMMDNGEAVKLTHDFVAIAGNPNQITSRRHTIGSRPQGLRERPEEFRRRMNTMYL